jgi:TorA maturation chaperone TorD
MLKDLLAMETEEVDAGETAALFATAAETAAECRARADVYRLLAGAFVEEATPEFITALRASAMQRQLGEAGLRFDADFTAAPLDALVDTLAIEYTTLFANSGGFPPVESVRLCGRFKQEPNFETMQTYRRYGFVLRPGRFEVFADQLGVELMFVAELLERAAQALDEGDVKEQRRLEKEIKRFWVRHLGRWARGYARLIEQTAAHSFYREMARFLGGFAAEEIAAMGLVIEDVDQARLVVPKAEVKVEFDPDEPVCNGCVSEAIIQQGQVQTLHDLR